MNALYDAIAAACARGEDTVLVTVAGKRGSAPRGVGAQMLVGGNGRLCGTIGGGIGEHEAERTARELLAARQSGKRTLRLYPNGDGDLGAVCGGEIDLDFAFLPAGDDALAFAQRELRAREKSAGCVYVFGGGHVAQALVPVLASVDFRCVVVEDRPEFARPELFPDAADVRLIPVEKLYEALDVRPEDYICVMTHGHGNDTECEAFALGTSARYIGVIGSRRKIAVVSERLMARGFTREDLARVHTPIGLAIGAETPAEIAVSIAAEMIKVRAGV